MSGEPDWTGDHALTLSSPERNDTHPTPSSETPQWRRGPRGLPLLCNACGTRYRRTGQLPACSAMVGGGVVDKRPLFAEGEVEPAALAKKQRAGAGLEAGGEIALLQC